MLWETINTNLLGLDGRHEAAVTLCAQTAGHASELGRVILSRSECFTFEIGKDETLIFQIDRDAARERRV
jgi:hypothetical protein